MKSGISVLLSNHYGGRLAITADLDRLAAELSDL